MTNRFYLCITALLAMGSACAMEKLRQLPVIVEERPSTRLAIEEHFLRLLNATNDVLLVRYKAFGDTQFCHYTLIPGQWLDFARRSEIASLHVKALREWISSERFIGPTNIADLAKQEATRLDMPNIRVTVHPAWNSAATKSLAAYALAVIGEKTLPYKYECHACDRLEVYSKLTDIFPQVARAMQDKVPIEPWHFLNVLERPTAYDLDKVYESLVRFWKPRAESKDAETQRFATDALASITAAYKTLKSRDTESPEQDERQFAKMVQQCLFENVQAYNVQSNIVEVLRSIMHYKGQAIKAASSCESAVAAFNDLKRTYPRFKSVMCLRQANEFIIYWIAKKFFESFSLESLAKAAFALGTKEAQDWLIFQIETKNEWRTNSFFVFTVFERFAQNFYIPLAKTLGKYHQALNLYNLQGNTPLIEAVERESLKAASFLIDLKANRFITNADNKMAYQLAQEKRKRFENNWSAEGREMRRQWDELIAALSEQQVALALLDSYKGEFR